MELSPRAVRPKRASEAVLLERKPVFRRAAPGPAEGAGPRLRIGRIGGWRRQRIVRRPLLSRVSLPSRPPAFAAFSSSRRWAALFNGRIAPPFLGAMTLAGVVLWISTLIGEASAPRLSATRRRGIFSRKAPNLRLTRRGVAIRFRPLSTGRKFTPSVSASLATIRTYTLSPCL